MRITVNSNTHFSLKANACFTSIRTLISALTEQSDKGHVSWTLFMRPKTSARAFNNLKEIKSSALVTQP